MRSCMGVALVAMTTHNKRIDINGSIDDIGFEDTGFYNALMLSPPYPKFKWSKKQQDIVIASFFWGYMSLQIPAGQLAHRFGSRRLLTGALFVNCIASLFLPHAAYYGEWIWTTIFRIIQGFGQACFFPGIHTFFGKWAPLEERGRLTSISYGGVALGSVFGLTFSGLIASTSLGWPGIFRFYGILSGIVGGMLWWFMADTPAMHTKISPAERRYIEDRLGVKEGDEEKRLPVPWARILRNPGLYAIVIATLGYAWGHVILYSEVPEFMDKVMKVDIKMNGLLTAIPFMVMWVTYYIFGWLTDLLIIKNILGVTNTRKLSYSLGSIIPALGFITLALMPKNIYMVETVLVIIGAFRVLALSAVTVNQIDLSPNFAGTLMSISNFTANLGSSFAPIVAGLILTDVKSEYLWSLFFYVAAAIYLSGNLFYVIFGTSERAKWDNPDFNEIQDEGLPMLSEGDEPITNR